MRVRTLVASLVLVACAFGLGRAAEQRPVADFHLVVAFDTSTREVSLECTAGCVWKTLTFGCQKDGACESSIDEYGMTE